LTVKRIAAISTSSLPWVPAQGLFLLFFIVHLLGLDALVGGLGLLIGGVILLVVSFIVKPREASV